MELPAQTGATPEQVYLHLVIIIILSDARLELITLEMHARTGATPE